MKGRIIELRNRLRLTQTEFGAKIGLTRNAVAAYERGIANPTGTAIIAIVNVFNVNRDWLETGEGEMFSGDPLEAQIRTSIQSSLAMQSLLAAWDQLDDAGREVFEAYARNFVAEYQQRLADRATAEAETIIDSAPSAPESGEKLG